MDDMITLTDQEISEIKNKILSFKEKIHTEAEHDTNFVEIRIQFDNISREVTLYHPHHGRFLISDG